MAKRDGRFTMSFAYPDGRTETHDIVRTVGSRRIQQYVANENGQYVRLPVAWDVDQNRWMNLSGSFFTADGDNFDKYRSSWDTNCIFCHNVKAQPNFNFQTRTADAEVAELGIACGACHGPGAEHADLQGSLPKKLLARLNGPTGGQMVSPREIDSDRATMICGHCHGQRLPEPRERIREIMSKGDPFNAGDDLSTMYRPIDRDTVIGHVSFATRFWTDGSPRLTAHEYQGLVGSACFTKGKPGDRISCLNCHTMHSGDIKGQIKPDMRTNVACTQCHQELADTAALTDHSKHQAGSAGSSCYACHMPEVVYGVQSFHPTHRITIPSPETTAAAAVPNACNVCHVDRSVNWAIVRSKELWPERYRSAEPSSDAQFDTAEGVRGLFAGDALTRALMADAVVKHSDASWYSPLLAEAFATENYAIVRYFAANGLAVFAPQLTKPDYLANTDSRRRQVEPFVRRIGPDASASTHKTSSDLIKRRKDVDIDVGE
jgi:predicted CXXCH cytochrome family protein